MDTNVTILDLYSAKPLLERSTDELRMMYAEAKGAGLLDYAGDILNAWEHILTTSYPRRQDRH